LVFLFSNELISGQKNAKRFPFWETYLPPVGKQMPYHGRKERILIVIGKPPALPGNSREFDDSGNIYMFFMEQI
jgi:hypothetical protein